MARSERRACPACGTWHCRTCGKKRTGVSRFVNQPLDCNGCGSVDGLVVPVVHTSGPKARDHEDETPFWTERWGPPRYPLPGFDYELGDWEDHLLTGDSSKDS